MPAMDRKKSTSAMTFKIRAIARINSPMTLSTFRLL